MARDVHILIKIPAFAGMTERGAGMAEGGNSSPVNANLRIGTQAGQEKDRHSNSPRNHAPGHTPSIIPARAAVTSTPGVIPAQAGILTRITFYEGPAVVVNCAGIPSRHLSYAKCNELCVPKSLVRIMAMGNSRRPYPD